MGTEVTNEMMDFLLNYGWAIILIILVLVAISSLGIYDLTPIFGK